MFITQITAIESKIQLLSEKLNQYRTLENQVESVKHPLAQIQQTAQALDPQIIPEMFTSLGFPATNFQTSFKLHSSRQNKSREKHSSKKQPKTKPNRKKKLPLSNRSY